MRFRSSSKGAKGAEGCECVLHPSLEVGERSAPKGCVSASPRGAPFDLTLFGTGIVPPKDAVSVERVRWITAPFACDFVEADTFAESEMALHDL